MLQFEFLANPAGEELAFIAHSVMSVVESSEEFVFFGVSVFSFGRRLCRVRCLLDGRNLCCCLVVFIGFAFITAAVTAAVTVAASAAVCCWWVVLLCNRVRTKLYNWLRICICRMVGFSR